MTRIVTWSNMNADTLAASEGTRPRVQPGRPRSCGSVACVNAFGNGVADDKLIHAYVEEMVLFYLGEDPIIKSVPTYDPAEPSVRTEILDRIDELVVKPRTGSGGAGVIVCPHA